MDKEDEKLDEDGDGDGNKKKELKFITSNISSEISALRTRKYFKYFRNYYFSHSLFFFTERKDGSHCCRKWLWRHIIKETLLFFTYYFLKKNNNF